MANGIERLNQAVEYFAAAALTLKADDLDEPWQWGDYNEGVRFIFFRVYETLRKLAADLSVESQAGQTTKAKAKKIMAQYNTAYWDLQAVLLPVDDILAEQSYDEQEWSIWKVLSHIVEAELAFLTSNADALKQRRAGVQNPAYISDASWQALEEEDPFFQISNNGPTSALISYYRQLHDQVLSTFINVTDKELETPVWYWESKPMSLQFRLHRFDSHLRQHTVQVENTLVMLGKNPNEIHRLIRHIYNALAEVGSVLLCLNELVSEQIINVVSEIDSYTNAIEMVQKGSK